MFKIVNTDLQNTTNIRNVMKSRVKSDHVENEILKGIDVIMNMEQGKDNEDKYVEVQNEEAMMDYALENDECLEQCADDVVEECPYDRDDQRCLQENLNVNHKGVFGFSGTKGTTKGERHRQAMRYGAVPLRNIQPIQMLKCSNVLNDLNQYH